MGISTELERLVVRLVGDGSDYEATLKKASGDTEKAVVRINKSVNEITSAQKKALSEAARVTESVLTPTEKYSNELRKLDALVKNGSISQTTYIRAVKQAVSALPEVSAAQQKHNEELKKARELTKAATTPLQQYKNKLSEVENHYKQGNINGAVYRQTVQNLNKEFNQGVYAAGAYGKKLESIGRAVRNAGLIMTAAVTLPVVGMVKSFASFDDAMTESTAIMGNVSAEMRKELEQTARTLSLSAKTSATDLAKSYFYLASAGMSAEQSIKALPVVEKFATAGAFDMALATDLLTDAQSALGLSSKDAEKNMVGMLRVSDVLVKANTLANASVQQFSESLTSEAGAAIKNYNMDLNESVAILATYADRGIKAQLAGNMFGRMTRLLIKAMNDNKSAFKQMNIPIEEFASTGKNLTAVIDGITKAVDGLGPAEKAAALEALGFEARIQQAILPLLGATDKIRGYNKELDNMGDITKEVAEKQLKSFSSQMKIVWNNIIDFANDIGRYLAPYIEGLSNFIKGLSEKWRSLSEDTKKAIAAVIGITAALGPLLTIIGTIMATVGGMAILISTAFAPTAIVAFSAAVSSALPIILAVGAGIAAIGAAAAITNEIIKEMKKDKVEKLKEEIDNLDKSYNTVTMTCGSFNAMTNIVTRSMEEQESRAVDLNYQLSELSNSQNQAALSLQKYAEAEKQKVEAERAAEKEKKKKKKEEQAEADLEAYMKSLESEIEVIKDSAKYIDEIEKGLTQSLSDEYEDRVAASIDFATRMSQNEYYSEENIKKRQEELKQITKQADIAELNNIPNKNKRELALHKYKFTELKKLYKEGSIQLTEIERLEAAELISIAKKQKEELKQITEQADIAELNNIPNKNKRELALHKYKFTELKKLYKEGSKELTEIERLETAERTAILKENDYWGKYVESMQNNMMTMDSVMANSIDSWTTQFGDFFASAIMDSDNLGESFKNMIKGMATSLLSAIGKMIAQWVAYKVTKMATDKAVQASAIPQVVGAAEAGALLAGINAYASAAAIPYVGWGLAPGAMAAAQAATQPMVAGVSAAMVAGLAHDGIDSVPTSGTWLLEKGERVLTKETAAKLDGTLDYIRTNMNEGEGTTTSQKSSEGEYHLHNHYDGPVFLDRAHMRDASRIFMKEMEREKTRRGAGI